MENTLTRLREVLLEAAGCGLLDDIQDHCEGTFTTEDFLKTVEDMCEESSANS